MADEKLHNEEKDGASRPNLESATTLTGKRKRHHPARTWIIVIVCVALVCFGVYWTANEFKPEEAPEPTAAPDYTTKLVEHKMDEVKSATVTYEGKTYTVLNEGDEKFSLEGHAGFSVDQDKAKSLISRGTTLTTQSTVCENCQNLAEYGLDKPKATMKFDYADGSSTTYELGNKSPMTYYYFKLAGDDNVYTVYSSIAETMMTSLEAVHTVEMPVTFDEQKIAYVKLERPESASEAPEGADTFGENKFLSGLMNPETGLGDAENLLTNAFSASDKPAEAATEAPTPAVTKAPTAAAAAPTDAPAMTVIEFGLRDEGDESLGIAAYKLTQPFVYDVDEEAYGNIAKSIAGIKLKEYVGSISEAGNGYGMENPIRLTVRDKDGARINFLIGSKADEQFSYICVDDTGDVYTTESSSVEFARTMTVAGVVNRFANIINIKKVDGLDIITPDAAYNLKIERIPELDEEGKVKVDDKGKEVINEVYYFNGAETPADSFKKLYQEVIGVMVNGMTEDYDVEGAPELTVIYHLNVAPNELKIEYVPYNRDSYAVRRDGHTYFYITNSTIKGVIKTLENYEA